MHSLPASLRSNQGGSTTPGAEGSLLGRELLAGWGADDSLSSPFGRNGTGLKDAQRGFVPFGAGNGLTGSTVSGAGMGLHLRTLALGGASSITRPFLQHPTINACSRAWAKAVAQARPVLYATEDPEAEEITAGPLYDLLQRPAPRKSIKDLMRSWSMHLGECGESDLILLGPGGAKFTGDQEAPINVPTEIRAECGSVVELKIDEARGAPLWWKLTNRNDAEAFTYEPAGVVQIAMFGPYDYFRGTGPVQAALRRAQIDFQADRLDEALIANGGTPTIGLSTDHTISEPQADELRRQYQKHNSLPEKNRMPLVLQKGLRAEKLSLTPAEMEAQQLRLWNRETIMYCFGVTKPILGITDDVNRANAREAMRAFWEETIIPLLDLFADQFNTGLIQRLRGPERNYRLDWDLTGVPALRDDQESIVTRFVQLYETGTPTWSEAAKMAGAAWDEIEGSEDRFTGQTAEQTNEPAVGDDSDEAADSDPRDDRASLPLIRALDPLEDPAARIEYAQRFDAALQPHDKALAAATGGVFRKWFGQVHRDLRALAAESPAGMLASFERVAATSADGDDLDALLARNREEWERQMREAVEGPLERVVEDALRTIAAEMGVPVVLSATSPTVLAFLAQTTLQLAEGPLSSLREAVRDTIVRVLADSNATGPLAVRIQDTLEANRDALRVMEDRLGTRSEMIARTETNRAANYGRFSEMRANGITQSRWVALSGARDSHAQLDGTTAVLGDEFGFGLRYPGDEQAAAKQVVNCRCTLAPIIPQDDDE